MTPSLIWQVMAFYSPDPDMEQHLRSLVSHLERQGWSDPASRLSITWLRCQASVAEQGASSSLEGGAWAPPRGTHWQGDQPRDPAGVVRLYYLAAAETWLQRRLLADDPELRGALGAMVRLSSHDATALVVDLLSGTTGGPSLPEPRFAHWSAQRLLVNDWLASLGWPELAGSNVCQKTWADGPYGRERDFHGPSGQNGNRLSTDATARLLHAVMAGAIVSPPACRRMRDLLVRSLDPKDGQEGASSPVDGFLGDALPAGARFWSLRDRSGRSRHEVAYAEVEGKAPVLLVVFSEGEEAATDASPLPEIARHLVLQS